VKLFLLTIDTLWLITFIQKREVCMNTNQNAVGWDFWLRWVLASFLGFAMGGVLGGVALYALAFGEGFEGMVIFGAIFGAAGGTMQWLVLRRNVDRSGGWVLATAIGGTLAGIAGELVFRRLPFYQASIIAPLAGATTTGVVGGILQWLVLRRRVVHAGWWVLASILGPTVGMGVGGPIVRTLSLARSTIEAPIVFGVLFGLGMGAIPGAALVWLLKHPKSGLRAGAASQGAK
jgi:hypothetical protein